MAAPDGGQSPPMMMVLSDAGKGNPSSTGDDAGAAAEGGAFNPSEFDVGTVRWDDLYASYFGPDGVASCTAQTVCHGNPAQTGAHASGFICGTTSASCWQSLSSALIGADGTKGLTSTYLYTVLRKSDGTGTMPYQSSYTFQPEDLARINSWVESGSPDD